MLRQLAGNSMRLEFVPRASWGSPLCWCLLGFAAMIGLARPASAQVGACCLPDNSCQQLTQASCTAVNGFFFGEGSGCAFVRCSSVGACCLPNGTCERRTQSTCVEAGGQFQGEGTPCAGTECPQPAQSGACCLPDGTCQSLSPQACTAAAGDYFGNNTVCANVNCDTPPPNNTPPVTTTPSCGNCGTGAPAALMCGVMLWALRRSRRAR